MIHDDSVDNNDFGDDDAFNIDLLQDVRSIGRLWDVTSAQTSDCIGTCLIVIIKIPMLLMMTLMMMMTMMKPSPVCDKCPDHELYWHLPEGKVQKKHAAKEKVSFFPLEIYFENKSII